MLSDATELAPYADWYLIACHGDLAIKLAQELRVGEDESGGIILRPDDDQALLSLRVEAGNLVMRALALNWTFTQPSGSSVQHLTLPPGQTIKLSFPVGSLVLRPELTGGAHPGVDLVIKLRPISPPTLTLTRVGEPVTVIEQKLLTYQPLPPRAAPAKRLNNPASASMEAAAGHLEPPAQARSDPAPTRPVEAEVIWLDPAQLLAAHQDAEAATEPLEPTPRTDAVRSSAVVAHLRRTITAVLAVLTLLAPASLFLTDGEDLGVHFLRSSYLPLDQPVDDLAWPEDMRPSTASADDHPSAPES